ncbi:hypothetical protein PIB30_011745 [Stylosanthes scabra]|uniref:Uncharacterized protein n=1 Tax=Stylosanthes scabra TaxID=79078 RepID=A0ABU6Z6G2_9FABA|nr:hypothetical protein [Stylosanthes scabra]
MVRIRSDSLVKGKAKLCRPPTRASPRLPALRSNVAMQIPNPTPNVPVKEAVTLTSRQRNDKALGWREKAPLERTLRLHVGGPADLPHCTVSLTQCRKKKWSSRSVMTQCRKKDASLEQNEAFPIAKGGGREDLPKNDVYDALWAMLDAESGNEAEEIPDEWDLDSVLQNWGKNEPDVGPAGPDQGPPPTEI